MNLKINTLFILLTFSNVLLSKNKFILEDLEIKFNKPIEYKLLKEDDVSKYKNYAIDLVEYCTYDKSEISKIIKRKSLYVFSNFNSGENIIIQKSKNLNYDDLYKLFRENIEKKCLLIGKNNLEILSETKGQKNNIGNYNSILLKIAVNNKIHYSQLFVIQSGNDLILFTFNNLYKVDNSDIINSIEYIGDNLYLELLNKAINEINNFKTDEALILINKAIHLDTTNQYAYKIRCRLYLSTSNYKMALNDAQVILKENSLDIETLLAKGICEYNLKEYQSSIKDFSTIILSDVSFISDNYSSISNLTLFTAYDFISHCYNKLNDSKNTIEYAMQSLNYTSDSNTISSQYYNIGVVYSNNLKDVNNAIKYYNYSIEYTTKNQDSILTSKIYYNRGLQHRKLGNYNKAISDYTLAISFNTNYFSAYVNRSAAYIKIDKFNNAIKDCNYVISNHSTKDPNLYNAYLNRGSAKILNNDKNGCKDILKAEELGATIDFNIKAFCK